MGAVTLGAVTLLAVRCFGAVIRSELPGCGGARAAVSDSAFVILRKCDGAVALRSCLALGVGVGLEL